MFFFFQAEDGIRDIGVTGVQTCALPISVDTREEIEELIAQIVALRDDGVTPEDQEQIDDLTGQVLGLAQEPCDPETEEGCVVEIVPPDTRRCFLPKDEPNLTPPGSPCSKGSWIQQHFLTSGT